MGKRTLLILAVTGVLVLAALTSLRFIVFNNDISVMLPQKTEIQKTFRFFQQAPLTRNVLVSFRLNGTDAGFTELKRAVDQFTQGVHSPMILQVISGADTRNSLEDIQAFLRLSPLIMDSDGFEGLNNVNSPAFVKEKLRAFYRSALLAPSSVMAIPLIRLDPLGFHKKSLQDLNDLSSRSEWAVDLQDGYFVSRDGRAALVILQTSVAVTDGFGARKLVDYVEGLLNDLPSGVSADPIAGHWHSVSNESVVKQDIRVTAALLLAVFLLLFLFLFRDKQAFFLFMIPSISVLFAVHICSWFFGSFSLIVLGMGAVIAGVAVDYCIHVYVALRSGQTRAQALNEVIRPVLAGAVTTVGVYAVFLFSSVPGYRELALFTAVSTFLSLGFAFVWLPRVLSGRFTELKPVKGFFFRSLSASRDKRVLTVWAAAVLLCLSALPFVRFQPDVKQYDGSSPEIFEREARFQKDWGSGERSAMLVIEAASLDKALDVSEQIRPEIDAILGGSPLTSLSDVMKSKSSLRLNLDRWNQFWQEKRVQNMREQFISESAVYFFSPGTFDPFFTRLQLASAEVENFQDIELLRRLAQRFSFESAEGVHLVAFFPDEDKKVGELIQKSASWPGVSVISARRFSSLLTEATFAEFRLFAGAIVVILPLLAFSFLKDVRLTLIALSPSLSSVLAILGIMTVFKLPVNAVSIVAVLVVGGYAIDYGLFMIYHSLSDLKTDTQLGVALSALTSLLGSGVLLFADHPVLFSFGSAMVLGVAAGYLTAIFAVPAFCRAGFSKREAVFSGAGR